MSTMAMIGVRTSHKPDIEFTQKTEYKLNIDVTCVTIFTLKGETVNKKVCPT